MFDFSWLQKSVNEKCRKLSKHIAFYTVDCRDSSGEIFVDLQDHIYSKVIILLHVNFGPCVICCSCSISLVDILL